MGRIHVKLFQIRTSQLGADVVYIFSSRIQFLALLVKDFFLFVALVDI